VYTLQCYDVDLVHKLESVSALTAPHRHTNHNPITCILIENVPESTLIATFLFG
jgi:hypothetical protein